MKKFTLVYKQAYSSTPCVVKFTLNKKKSANFKEVKLESVELKNNYTELFETNKIKYNLSDIDKITNQYNCSSDFFRALHVYGPLHENFISYINNGHLRYIQPIYGRDCFNELFDSNAVEKDYVEGSRVREMVYNFCKNDDLRRKFMKKDYLKSSVLSVAVNDVGMYSKAMDSEPSLEISEALSSAKKEMFKEFRKYHFYREALRCFDDYMKELELQEQKNQKESNFKKDEPKTLIKRPRYPKNVDGQVFFDGFDEE